MDKAKERMILGSGEIFAQTFTGDVPDVEAICVDANRLFYVSGGATLEYKPSSYTGSDDLGVFKKTVLTEEEATLKSGAATVNAEVLEKLCDTGRVSLSQDGKRRHVKIGGIKNAKNTSYVVCFWHKDEADGDIWVIIVGRNQAGFSLAFTKDKETVVDVEFKCEPMDNEGTLIDYIEEVLGEAETEQAQG